MTLKTAIIVGASGLVGGELLQILLADPAYAIVVTWTRRPLKWQHEKLKQQIVDFDHLAEQMIEPGVNHLFCCLGTTIGKAKSQEAFAKVDLEYPLILGRMAKAQGFSQFVIISAMGADPDSSVFYSRTKGRLEAALRQLSLQGLHIVRPSLLTGDRKDFRPGEAIAAVLTRILSFLFIGPLKKYKPIPARTVALAMAKIALRERTGFHVYPSDALWEIAAEQTN